MNTRIVVAVLVALSALCITGFAQDAVTQYGSRAQTLPSADASPAFSAAPAIAGTAASSIAGVQFPAIARTEVVDLGDQDDPGYPTYKEGYKLVLEEKWEQARKKFAEVMAKYPKSKYTDDAEYWTAYSWKYTDKKKAVEAYKSFLKKYPSSNYYDDAAGDLNRLESPRASVGTTVAPALAPGAVEMVPPNLEAVTRAANEAARVAGKMQATFPSTGRKKEEDPELRMRMEALQALANSSKDEKTFELLKETALDGNQPREMREVAFHALTNFKERDVTDIYLQILKNDRDIRIKQTALYFLGNSMKDGDERIFKLIKEIALDSKQDREIREAAMYSLRESKRSDVLNVFVQMAKSDSDKRLRQTALYYIGQSARSDEEAFKILKDYALDSHQDRNLREAALYALGELKKGDALNLYLDIAKNDPDERLRMTAIYYIGEHGRKEPDKVLKIYREFLFDQQQPREVREGVMHYLANVKSDAALDLLIQIAKTDPNEQIQSTAIYHIGQYSNDKSRSIATLISLFSTMPANRTRSLESILYAVASVGNDQAVEFLGKVAKTHQDYDMRRKAVYYLGNIGGEKARAVLYEILKGKQ